MHLLLHAGLSRRFPNALTPVQVFGLTGAVSVAGGTSHSVAVANPGGQPWAWGSNALGQLGRGAAGNSQLAPVPMSGTTSIVQVAAADSTSYELKSDNTLWASGDNSNGAIGDGTNTQRPTPVQVPGAWLAIAGGGVGASGGGFAIGLKTNGTVWAWGYNGDAELGDGTRSSRNAPVAVTGLAGTYTAVAAGYYESYALKSDGTVWAWGDNETGQMGNGVNCTPRPCGNTAAAKVTALSGITAIAGQGASAVVRKSDGTVWAWGGGWQGNLGDGCSCERDSPVQATGITTATTVAGGDSVAYAVLASGTIKAWGDNTWGELGNGTTTSSGVPVTVSVLTSMATTLGSIAAGEGHALAVKSDGTVWSWGLNNAGQLGVGTMAGSPAPVTSASTAPLYTQVSEGDFFSVALRSDGTVWTWGANTYGELGNGTTTSSSTPVEVCAAGQSFPCGSFLSGVTAVSAGGSDALALLSNQQVWSWGLNMWGELGNNTHTNSSVPVQALGITTATAIAANAYDSAARLGNGTIKVWGTNHQGEAGNGTNCTPDPCGNIVPTQVGAVTTWTGISGRANQWSFLATRSDGSVWGWGSNVSSSIGDNGGGEDDSPTQTHGPGNVGFLTDIASVMTCHYFTLAVRTDGTVWSWGSNLYGQLGTGTTTSSNTPVQVSGITTATAVACGDFHSLALLANGTVQAWGDDESGQLGNNSTTTTPWPTAVTNLTGVSAISAGGSTSMAVGPLTSPPPTVTNVSPSSGTTAGGTSVTITGTNFVTGSTTVVFGPTSGTSIVVVDAQHITVTSPAGIAGPVYVWVTTPAGMAPVSVNDVFTYIAYAVPTVTAVSPPSGQPSGSTLVTVTGTGFVNGSTTVAFGGGYAGTSVTWLSATQLTVVSPAHPLGVGNAPVTVDVQVTTPGGTSATSAGDQFTYSTQTPGC